MPIPQRPRATERDYSHRSLYDKLGIPPAGRVALLGLHDDWFVTELRGILSKPPSRALRAKYDAIILRLNARPAWQPVWSTTRLAHTARPTRPHDT
jgi:hypothetical protein